MNSEAAKHSASPDDSEVVELLRNLEERLAGAWVEGDRSFIEKVLADDWSVTDLTGRVLKKAEVLEEAFGSNDRKIASMRIDEVRVRTFEAWQLLPEELMRPASIRAKLQKLRFGSQMCLRIETEIGKSSLRKLL